MSRRESYMDGFTTLRGHPCHKKYIREAWYRDFPTNIYEGWKVVQEKVLGISKVFNQNYVASVFQQAGRTDLRELQRT